MEARSESSLLEISKRDEKLSGISPIPDDRPFHAPFLHLGHAKALLSHKPNRAAATHWTCRLTHGVVDFGGTTGIEGYSFKEIVVDLGGTTDIEGKPFKEIEISRLISIKKFARDWVEIFNTFGQVGVPRDGEPLYNPVSAHFPPTTTTNSGNTYTSTKSWIEKWFGHVSEYLTPIQTPTDPSGNLMVVAILVAGISYQAGMNPPGGVWQQYTIDNHTCMKPDMCRAGTAVFKDSEGFLRFSLHNTWAFVTSIGVVLLHFWEFAFKSKVGNRLMTVTTCLMLDNILGAYISTTNLMVAPSRENKTLFYIKYAWKCMLMPVVVVHTAKIWFWLMFDKVTSYLRPGNILCRCKWMRTVAFVVGTLGTVSLFVWVD